MGFLLRAKSSWDAWIPVLAWAGLIFWLSSIPSLRGPWDAWDFVLRKGAHVFEYAVLAFLAARGLATTGPGRERPWFAAGAAAALYAASDEWHQNFVVGRHGSPADVAIDAAGAVLGALLHRLWSRRGPGA